MFPFDSIERFFQDIRQIGNHSKDLVTITTIVGLMVLLLFKLKLVWKIIQGLRLYVTSQYCNSVDFRRRYGQWAVISGSTDGIGLAFARELARRGMSIIVIGRNEHKLAATKNSLEREPNVGEVVTIKIDLSDSSLANFESIREQIDPDNRDIGILINNAGTFPIEYLRYNRFQMEFIKTLVDLNILATLHLTRMIMPGMLERAKGLLVNVSSITGSLPTPYMCVYGATKFFVDSFSRQLQIEYSQRPIDIINLAPGGVQTSQFARSSTFQTATAFNPTPDDYARSALNAISTRIGSMSGTLSHGLLKQVVDLFPIIFTVSLRLRAKQFQLSPVPKRRAGGSRGASPFQADDE